MMMNTEEYVVKFWCVGSSGWKEQREESVFLNTKSGHKKAGAIVKAKWRKAPYLQDIEVVSVTYC